MPYNECVRLDLASAASKAKLGTGAFVFYRVYFMPNTLWIPSATGLLLSLLLLALALRARKRQRLLRDLPTSKVQGVFIGLVELKGTAESTAPLTSFLAGQACIHYAWRVDEHWSRIVTETYTDSKGRSQTRTRHESGWTTVDEGGQMMPFYLRDDSGCVLVRPEGAKLEPMGLFDETVGPGDALYYGKGPATTVPNSDHRRRFVESGIPLHASLYLVGQARERSDIVAPEIAADRHAELFLISTRSEERVSAGYAWGYWLSWLGGLIAASGGIVLGLHLSQSPLRTLWIAGFSSLAGYLVLSGSCWVWMAFNSLIRLRGRVRQGWALIDVELKRRHDLLPPLVAAVEGLSLHEKNVQEALAALRSQQQATPPGAAGPDYAGLTTQLLAITERYPSLTAQAGFLQLQQTLITTEQRIALARGYYNDIATHYATRLEQVPDRWVAMLGALRPEPLLAAESFVRAPVTVDLS